jgi:hydroxymethylbilane synthase
VKNNLVRIGSRGSDLALWQAQWVEERLTRHDPSLRVTMTVVKTKGDKVVDSPLAKIGDKGLFTREIEQALLEKRIDLAVHSLKDLPTELPAGLMVGAVCTREDVRDVFIPRPGSRVRTLKDQPDGAVIATGSLRRKCQLLHIRPDLQIVDVRGNLNTRMKKLAVSDWAGMILARAGVVRLGWEEQIGEVIATDDILPAVGQGAIGIEIRSPDDTTVGRIGFLADETATRSALAERALLRRLEGGCQVPIGAYARMEFPDKGQGLLVIDAMVGSLDGVHVVRGRRSGDPHHAEDIGRLLAEDLLARGADRILQEIRPADGSHEPA